MVADKTDVQRYVEAICHSGLSIYDSIEVGDPELWIPTPELEQLLNGKMSGISLSGLPIRTRSKVVKEHVCRSLGYPVPPRFKKVQPRFPGQLFDTYVQKSNNLQIWNEELAPSRRYVIIRVDPENVIGKIRVVTGKTLASLETTGTLTQKYQARLLPGYTKTELVSDKDTLALQSILRRDAHLTDKANPVNDPIVSELLPISTIFKRLRPLVGKSFADAGYSQERNQGALLHRLVCLHLGYSKYYDDGQFPDIRNQLLEVKLQTSPTIDLGLVRPNSEEALDIPKIDGKQVRRCDVRYALFYARTDGETVNITHFFLCTGEQFFTRFSLFRGKVLNKKRQIPLPPNFFD